MQKLSFEVDVTEDQFEIMSRMQVMVLFLTEEQKDLVRQVTTQTHHYLTLACENTDQLTGLLRKLCVSDAEIDANLSALSDPSQDVLEAFDALLQFLGRAYFAQPRSNVRTLQ